MIPEKVLEYISHSNTPVLWAATDHTQDFHFDKNAPVSNSLTILKEPYWYNITDF